MLAEDFLREGNVDEALAELKKAVQQNPAEPKYRVFLFQLMSVLGKWDSALNQLEVAGEMDPGTLAMVQAYREAIRCEAHRGRVFTGKASPLVFGEPDRWIALLLESLKLVADGNYAQAQQLRDDAFGEAPGTAGKITLGDETSREFQWIADADPRIGPVLEAYFNGQYYWVPFHRISQVVIEPPADLRDFVWMPAHFTWANGGETFGMIPSLYPGSADVDEASIRLGRKTDWTALGDGPEEELLYVGRGQRMIATDEGEYGLLDLREVTLEVELEETAEGEGQDEASPEGAAESDG